MPLLELPQSAYKNVPLQQQPTVSVLDLILFRSRASAEQTSGQFYVAEATMDVGRFVPLHRHPESEWMYILEGTLQVLSYQESEPLWLDIRAGESLLIPPNAKHALRNNSIEQVRMHVVSPSSIGEFFEEVGRPEDSEGRRPQLTPEWHGAFVEAAIRRGYWMGSPQENAAIGITL